MGEAGKTARNNGGIRAGAFKSFLGKLGSSSKNRVRLSPIFPLSAVTRKG
jgi:hypothetical protein